MATPFAKLPRGSFVLVLALLAPTACQSSAVEDQDNGGQAISGGSKATADFSAVGFFALVSTRDDGTRKVWGALCTGTLIAPRVALSAASCLRSLTITDDDRAKSEQLGFTNVSLAFGVGDRTADPKIALVKPFVAPQPAADHPHVTNMGYVVLETALDVTPMAVDTGAARKGCDYTTVGYGLESTDSDQSAERANALAVCNDDPADPAKPFQLHWVTAPQGSVCTADGGDPLIDIASGAPRLVGVLDGFKEGTTCGVANTINYYVATSHNAALVNEALAAGDVP